jgi:hypothetical protein
MQHCKNCLLPAAVPRSDIDSSGVCAPCRTYRPQDELEAEQVRQAREADLESAIRAVKGKNRYDALVCLSGGKDSIYLLYRAKVEYGLNVLAFTTDVNIPDIAWSNIRLAVTKLGVDHLVFRPSGEFYRKLFRYLLQNQEERGAVYTVSYVYAPLFEGDALAVATERGIPLVLAGYSPGQPEKERMEYEFSRKLISETDWTPPGLRQSGQFTDAELARFWNAKRLFAPGTAFPRYLAPFHAWQYDQDEIMKRVYELGFVAKRAHASPVYSNYPINWLLMYSDLRQFGYNPYAPEFAALVRSGKASRRYWRLMGPVVNFMIRNRVMLGAETSRQMRWLGLKDLDLQINRPRGAYDPPLG